MPDRAAGRSPPRWSAILVAALAVALAATSVAPAAAQSPTPEPTSAPQGVERPDPLAPATVLQDLRSGQVLFQERAGERRPVASLTKIMTALLVLERSRLSDRVTVSPAAVSQPGSDPLLVPGETLTVRALLYAMMLPSSNDAAVALAEHVAGSSTAFVTLMNERAAELGLRDTSFASPSGYDSTGYSTARDVAALTRVALRSADFSDIVRTYDHRLPRAPGGPRVVENRNLLLWFYPGAIGVKTGYLAWAGHCLAAAAERDGTRLVTVVLGHPDTSFGDGALLLDYGYRGFERTTVVRIRERVGTMRVGAATVPVVSGGELSALVRLDPPGRVATRLVPRAGLSAPVHGGERVGRVVVLVDGHRVGEVPAIAATSASAIRPSSPAPSPAAAPTGTEGSVEVLRTIGILGGMLREMADAFL